MHDKLLLFSKFLISPRLTERERESRAICRGAFAPKNGYMLLVLRMTLPGAITPMIMIPYIFIILALNRAEKINTMLSWGLDKILQFSTSSPPSIQP